MYLIEAIPLTKIPIQLPQILSYFSAQPLSVGSFVLAPLGRRQVETIVIETHKIGDVKMEIKKAGYELRPITKIIKPEPILTEKQIDLALWLSEYYLASPGIFLKMSLSKEFQNKIKYSSSKPRQDGARREVLDSSLPRVISRGSNNKLILTPTIAEAQNISQNYENAAIWHSELSKKQQNEIWWKIKNNEAQTIIGTRSAIFLPFTGLKQIIIEDGANPSHKSWDMFPHYRTLEAAQKLAEIFKAKLTIKSEIPSIEQAETPPPEKLTRSRLIRIADMRREIKDGNFSIFSRPLQTLIKDSLTRQKQIVLFVNRRGAANFVLCRDCGYIAKCQNCEAPLAYHLINSQPIMLCHRCGFRTTPPDLCPSCQSHRIKTVGAGTQKVELETQKMFPKAKTSRLDSDAAPDTKTQKTIIENFIGKKYDILIATQIVFSWLQDFKNNQPNIAIISADTLLHLPDFRSGERTYQLIKTFENILGPNSELIIQTYNPETSVIKCAADGDWTPFFQEEIETRQALDYPPFSQLVKLTLRHKNPQKSGQEAKILVAKLKLINKNTEIEISDALPAFIPKEKGNYVWNIIIKFKISQPEIKISSEFLHRRNSLLQYVPSGWEIDVDPDDLL